MPQRKPRSEFLDLSRIAPARRLFMACVILLSSLSGCVGSDTGDVRVVLNAPQTGEALQVGIFVDKANAKEAEFEILFDGSVVYPKAGSSKMPLSSGSGNANVKYADFVIGNGDYVVKAIAEGKAAQGTVEIVKFVESVRVQVTYTESSGTAQVSATLLAQKASPVQQSPRNVATKGVGMLTFYHEGETASSNPQPFEQTLSDADAGIVWRVSTSEFSAGRGNYTAIVTFKNSLAVQNTATNDPFYAGLAAFEIR